MTTRSSRYCSVKPEALIAAWETSVGSGLRALAREGDWEAQRGAPGEEPGFRHGHFHGALCDNTNNPIDQDSKRTCPNHDADQIDDFPGPTEIQVMANNLMLPPTALGAGDQTAFTAQDSSTNRLTDDCSGAGALSDFISSHTYSSDARGGFGRWRATQRRSRAAGRSSALAVPG